MVEHKLISEMNRKEKNEYNKIHLWLNKSYGKACQCNDLNCEVKSNTFHWALIHGFNHDYERKNYIQLCRPCHSYYDIIRLKLEKALKDGSWSKSLYKGKLK